MARVMEATVPQRWRARPALARALRVAILVVPASLGTLVSYVLARFVDRPDGFAQLGWWAGLLGVSTVVIVATDRVSRRFVPVAAMLKLSLIFPDRAPSRFAVALRTGTPKQLERRIADVSAQGLSDDASLAARELLELVAALSHHDRLTRGHCERVRAYTDLIAEELKLSDHDRQRLHWAGMLHDIGKLAVPAAILQKPGKLTADEFDVIKTHPAEGMRIAGGLAGFLGEWIAAIGEHHERWDGRGYPAGLSGKQISLAGRIVAVADTFDVITAARSYKKPIPAEAAREELARCSGRQFDPTVVRAFLAIGVGRLRKAAMPLSWLAQVPLLGPIATAPIAPLVAVSALLTGLLINPMQESQQDEPIAAPRVELTSTTTSLRLVASIDVSRPDSTTTPGSLPPTSQASTTLGGSSTTVATTNVPVSTITPATTNATATTSTTTTTTTTLPATTTTAASTSSTPITVATAPTTTPPTELTDCARARAGDGQLNGAYLVACDLSFVNLSNATLVGANLSKAIGTSANFSNANFDQADMTESVWSNAVMSGAILRGTKLDNANFTSANLSGAVFANATGEHARFASAVLANADLRTAILQSSDFRGADLTGATLAGAFLRLASVMGALIGGANFHGTTLFGATGTPQNHHVALWNTTTCPDGTVRNTDCYA